MSTAETEVLRMLGCCGCQHHYVTIWSHIHVLSLILGCWAPGCERLIVTVKRPLAVLEKLLFRVFQSQDSTTA